MKKAKTKLLLGLTLFAAFIIFTLSLKFVGVKPIGPNGSAVAYANINNAVHQLFGVNMALYNITDWAGVAAIFVAVIFAVLGLIQWIKRKSLLKVDKSILILGLFYIVVFGTYLFFETHVVNFRPVLINERLEPSYPSSTTMLAACIIPTAIIEFHRLIKNVKLRVVVNTCCAAFMIFMIIGRLICGVHWFTDILGGLLFSSSVVLIYISIIQIINNKSALIP